MYEELQQAYAAGVGFKSKTASWQQTRVTFGDELRESSEKDPNIEAVGIGGQIYGKRADMIIVDDAVTLKNANEFEKQIRWLTQDEGIRANLASRGVLLREHHTGNNKWDSGFGVAFSFHKHYTDKLVQHL